MLVSIQRSRYKNFHRPGYQPGEPIPELAKLEWVITPLGREADLTKMMHMKSNTHDYDKLCNLGVLGIPEALEKGSIIHQEFKDQPKQKADRRYKTGFIWKSNKNLLPDNKEGSIC